MARYPVRTTNETVSTVVTFVTPSQTRKGGLSMKRLKSVPLAIGALTLAAGTVAAFSTMPESAGPGLQKASDASGKTVPVRAGGVHVPPAAPANEPAEAVDLPDAATHGEDVSAAA